MFILELCVSPVLGGIVTIIHTVKAPLRVGELVSLIRALVMKGSARAEPRTWKVLRISIKGSRS